MQNKCFINRNESGFSVLEVLIALVISGCVALSVTYASTTQFALNTLSEKRTDAILAVQQVLDGIRGDDIGSLPTSGIRKENVEIAGRVFEVRTGFCIKNTYCTSKDIRAIHCEASLLFDEKKEVLYEVDTVFAQLR